MDKLIVKAAMRLAKHNQHGFCLEGKLVAALNAAEMSAKQIAADIGVSQQYLSDVKKGRRLVSRDLVERLASCR